MGIDVRAVAVLAMVADSGMGIDVAVWAVRVREIVAIGSGTAIGGIDVVDIQPDEFPADVVALGFPFVTWGKGSSVIGVLKMWKNQDTNCSLY